MWDIYTCCYKGKARARKKILSSCRFRKRCEVEEGQVTYQSHLIPKIITVLLHRSKGKNIIGGTFCLPSILFLWIYGSFVCGKKKCSGHSIAHVVQLPSSVLVFHLSSLRTVWTWPRRHLKNILHFHHRVGHYVWYTYYIFNVAQCLIWQLKRCLQTFLIKARSSSAAWSTSILRQLVTSNSINGASGESCYFWIHVSLSSFVFLAVGNGGEIRPCIETD